MQSKYLLSATLALLLPALACGQTAPAFNETAASPQETAQVLAVETTAPTLAPTIEVTSTPAPTPTPVPVYELYGVRVMGDAAQIDLSGVPLQDATELDKLLGQLPAVQRVDMVGCGLSDESMAALCDAHPTVKFVWEISLGYWGKLRTDATAFTMRSSKSADEMKYRLHTEDIQMLRYCTELVALDLGHQQIEDISALAPLTKLQVLILADNKISDLTPLEGMQELVYLELFMNRIVDVSPLAKLQNLKDLNLCTNRIEDPSPLAALGKLERLWYSNNKYSYQAHLALAEQLPNCICNRTVWDETADGWREHERYFWMRSFFEGAPRYK